MLNTPTEEKIDLDATLALADEIKATKYVFAVTVPLLGTELYDKYVYPRLTKEEYAICGERITYQDIADPRFRLTKHNINMAWLFIWVRLRYMIAREFFDSIIWFLGHLDFYRKSSRYEAYKREVLFVFPNKLCSIIRSTAKRIMIKTGLFRGSNR